MVAAWAMLGYGVKKLLGAQFPTADLVRLVQPSAQASPMGMLWTFMGVSALYSFFGGLRGDPGRSAAFFPGLATLAPW